ncbi:MAG TPA: TonB-dependent receptor plug domain-containing protein [Chthoniobacterales bacterium]|nr:TonB-dependent receptor plug domain-containing protein [Chthoniobacterales bacterium]
MIKCAMLLALLSIALPLGARGQDLATITQTELRDTGEIDLGSALARDRSDLFTSLEGNPSIHGLPTLVLLDGRRLPDLHDLGVSDLDLVPIAFVRAVQVEQASPIYGADGPGGVVNMELNRAVGGGEAGFRYGSSVGGGGGSEMQGYIFGGVNDGGTSVFGGISHTESNVRFGGFGR